MTPEQLTHVTDTRDDFVRLPLKDAITTSQPPSGGLFVPQNDAFPQVDSQELHSMETRPYPEVAQNILGKFDLNIKGTDFTQLIDAAYGDQWHDEEITPLAKMQDGLWMLELGHGPTFAFKNVAMELLGRYLDLVSNETTRALGASSGDTINAAHYAVDGAQHLQSIFALPKEGPSRVQMLQALRHQIQNAMTILIDGDFDDAQSAIKTFNSPEYAEFKAENNFVSFNSIQILRILAQVVYYFRAYTQLMKHSVIHNGDPVNFSVPSANFGDALAGLWARQMGLPIGKINVATNANNILDEFLQTGRYEPPRNTDGTRARAKITSAPSQDITVSSNFERALYWACSGDTDRVRGWMEDLKAHGFFEVDDQTLAKLREVYTSSTADDTAIEKTQRWTWERYKMIIDPHTATAVYPLLDKIPNTVTACLSTSHSIQFDSPDGVPQTNQHSGIVHALEGYQPYEGRDFVRSASDIDSLQRAIEQAVDIINKRVGA